MNAVITLCHFCELHGPRTIFNTQGFKISKLGLFNGKEQLLSSKVFNNYLFDIKQNDTQDNKFNFYPNIETCLACQSSSCTPNKTFLLSKDEASGTSFVSSQYPIQEELYSLTRQAGIRSLSCEVHSEKEGPIYFGDDARGHVISYTFLLKDIQARGFHKRYSILVLMKDKMFLMNSWSFFINHFEEIIKKLQDDAMKIFKSDEEKLNCTTNNLRASSVDTFKRHRSVGAPRPLTELIGDVDIWKELHSKFTWILKACGMRLQEKIAQGRSFDIQESTEHRGFIDCLTLGSFEKILHHLYTGQKILVKSSYSKLQHEFTSFLKCLLPPYLLHPTYLENIHLENVGDENILFSNYQNIIDHCNYLTIIFTNGSSSTGVQEATNIHKLTAQVYEPMPINCRPPQIVSRICRLYSDEKYSSSVLNLYLASLIDDWMNKVEMWAFLHNNKLEYVSNIPSTSGKSGVPEAKKSVTDKSVSNFLLSVGALDCDIPLLDALISYYDKYTC